ncbi:hypothetical protein [Streptomyces sp. bgisy126]|uniref:hypothetical protein n=1 Tax=unclassified Streptomyces TaxID=2593676 RepID=UPI003EB79921
MRPTAAGSAGGPRTGSWGHTVDWLLTDGEGILTFWVLVFGVFNVLRGVYCLVRDRRRRRRVRAMTARGVDPVRAAYLTGDARDAAEAAVLVLAAGGFLRVADGGGLRLASPGRMPRDPVLTAFVRGAGGVPGVKVYEIPDHPGFEEFRTFLRERERDAGLPMTTGLSRPLIAAFAAMSVFFMGLHVVVTEAPVPFDEGARQAAWLLVCLIVWTALWAVAALWPGDGRRRWPSLDAHCRAQVECARATVPESTRRAVATSKYRPRPAPEPRRAGSRPNGSWADDIVGDSCGGCGGCGGE